MGATAVTMLRMETMGQRGVPRYFRKRGVSVREAWNTSKSAHGPWRLRQTPALSLALPAKMFLLRHNKPCGQLLACAETSFCQMGLPELAPAKAA